MCVYIYIYIYKNNIYIYIYTHIYKHNATYSRQSRALRVADIGSAE